MTAANRRRRVVLLARMSQKGREGDEEGDVEEGEEAGEEGRWCRSKEEAIDYHNALAARVLKPNESARIERKLLLLFVSSGVCLRRIETMTTTTRADEESGETQPGILCRRSSLVARRSRLSSFSSLSRSLVSLVSHRFRLAVKSSGHRSAAQWHR